MLQTNKLLSLLNIQSGEVRLVLLVLAYAILLYAANVLAQTAALSLFLAQFDAQSLPYTYIGLSVAAAAISTAYLKLSERFALPRMLSGSLGLVLLTLAGYWLSLRLTPANWLTFSLPIYVGVVNTLIFTAFWNLLGRLFNLQQGKRLFGLLTSGEHIATTAAGFLAPLLVAWLGALDLLGVSVVFLMGAWGLLIYLNRTYAAHLHSPSEEETTAETPPAANPSLKERYILLIFGLYTLYMLATYFVDNIFYLRVETQYPDEDHLAGFLGFFFGLGGALSLIVQVFVTGRLFSQYGVRLILLVTPLMLGLGAALAALIGAFSGGTVVLFWLAALTYLAMSVLASPDTAAFNVLYQPLPARQRTRLQTILDGVLSPIAGGVAGLILLLLGDLLGFGPVQLGYVLLFLLAGWLAAAVLVSRDYPRKIQQALNQRRLSRESFIRPDRTSLALLQQNLTSPHVGVVLYTLDLLEATAPEAMLACLPSLLAHPEREVRLDTLRRVERLGLTAAVPLIQARLKAEGSRPVQGASLRVLAALGDAAAFEAIYPYLDHPEPDLRQGALVGLLRSGELEAILAAGEKLNELVQSPQPAERQEAAQVLGEAGIGSFYRPLLKLLRDDTPSVRRAALAAAGKMSQPKLWPALIDHLASPQTRGAAAAALVTAGEEVLPQVAAAFEQPHQNRTVLLRLTRVAGRLGGPAALALLKEQLHRPDAELRYEILLALSRGGYRAGAAERVTFDSGFQTEADRAAHTLALLVALDADVRLSRLHHALTSLLARQQACLLLWLACLFDARAILSAWEVLHRTNGQASEEQRAYALEVLEVQLPTAFRVTLRPWLDELSPLERWQRLNGQVKSAPPGVTGRARLAEIITGPDEWFTPWIKVCALDAVGQLGAVEQTGAVIAALDAPEPLLRQTAAWVLARLDSALYRQHAPQLQQDAAPQVVETTQAIQFSQEGARVMLTPIEKIIHLKAIDFFADTPEEVLAEVAAALPEVEFKAGEVILAKGETSSALYLIVEGQVRRHDGPQELASLGENDLFGELTILNPIPQSATVTALRATRLLRLEQEPLRELLEDHSEVAWRIMQRLAQRLQRSSENRAEQARDDLLGGLKEKLAARLGRSDQPPQG